MATKDLLPKSEHDITNMVQCNVESLFGDALDWAVGHYVDEKPVILKTWKRENPPIPTLCEPYHVYMEADEQGPEIDQIEYMFHKYSPSTRWEQLGPMIVPNKVCIAYHAPPKEVPFATTHSIHPHSMFGETELVAICRALLAGACGTPTSEGFIIDVPRQLVENETHD